MPVALAPPSGGPGDVAGEAHPPLYRASGGAGADLLLLGTIHLGPAEGWRYSTAIEAALRSADSAVLEIVPDESDVERIADTLARIAARLRTTVKKILEVNPDMQSPEIEPNQEVCVMPCTEEAYKDAPLNPYNGAAINGVGAGYREQVPRLSKDPVFDYPLTR